MVEKKQCTLYKRCGCADAVTGKRLGGRCSRLAEEGHGRWYFAVQVTGVSGRRERIRRGGYPSAEQARKAGQEFQSAEEAGPVGHSCTVGRWLRHWLATHHGIRPTTRRSYEDHLRIHLLPHLGRIRLSELTGRDVARMFTALAARRNRYGLPIATSTLERVRATLRTALNAAVREGLIPANPARGLRLPRAQRPYPVVWTARRVAAWRRTGERPSVAVWTAEQLTQFLAATRDDRLHVMWRLIALRGLRRGEAAGLRWADLDLESAELTVTHQLVQIGRQVSAGPPKSAASRRTIALDAETVRLLYRHERTQQREQHDRKTPEYVFTRSDGAPLRPDWLTHRFAHLVRESDLPPVRLHDLRHGAATLALAAGSDLRVVQGTLGHASIVLTADTYTSVLPQAYHQSAKATARLVMRAARKTARKVRKARTSPE
ncbi:site-specific integrase [Planomonospora algeriensis]